MFDTTTLSSVDELRGFASLLSLASFLHDWLKSNPSKSMLYVVCLKSLFNVPHGERVIRGCGEVKFLGTWSLFDVVFVPLTGDEFVLCKEFLFGGRGGLRFRYTPLTTGLKLSIVRILCHKIVLKWISVGCPWVTNSWVVSPWILCGYRCRLRLTPSWWRLVQTSPLWPSKIN